MALTTHTLETAPDTSKEMVRTSMARYGFLPNLHGVMAGSPVMYEAYQQIGATYAKSRLSVLERQVVLMAINHANECHYCMAAHSLIATGEKMPPEILAALREGTPLHDARLEALRRFAVAMTEGRGWLPPGSLETFRAAGYTEETVLEVIVAVAYKVMSNYVNHIVETPLDPPFARFAWRREAVPA